MTTPIDPLGSLRDAVHRYAAMQEAAVAAADDTVTADSAGTRDFATLSPEGDTDAVSPPL